MLWLELYFALEVFYVESIPQVSPYFRWRRPCSVPFRFFTCLQVGKLRNRFINSIAPNGLAADRRGVIPASGFCISAMQIWKVIQENKDLNLPAHKVMLLCFLLTVVSDK